MADAETLYRHTARARAFELALAELWQRGLISGELHLGTGEEAVAAGIVTHMREGDALLVDHRGTPPLAVRGVDLEALVREMLGRADGLCRGRGGHMHLMSRRHLAAANGIVGAAAPLACGFALAARTLRPGNVAVAFFGEGAMNQGMLLEALNLAAALKLSVVFVCKDNGWAITTESPTLTAGEVAARAEAFGLQVARVNGLDAVDVHEGAESAFTRARAGDGPGFVLARCSRLDGHMLGDQLLSVARRPVRDGASTLGRMAASVLSLKGGTPIERAGALARIVRLLGKVRKERRNDPDDPVRVTAERARREDVDVLAVEREAHEEVRAAVRGAVTATGPGQPDAEQG